MNVLCKKKNKLKKLIGYSGKGTGLSNQANSGSSPSDAIYQLFNLGKLHNMLSLSLPIRKVEVIS